VAVLAGVVLALLLSAGPAAAHVVVRVEPAQAGARDAVVTFTAAAESDTAGISAVQVQLPDGIAPGDVTLASGPPDWALTPGTDGYTVTGPPLPVGAEVSYAIRVRQLPDAPSVAFRTVQNYTDGRADRWIEVPAPGGAEPANPAPVATLAPAAGGSSTPGPAPSSPTVAAAQPPDSTDSPDAAGLADGGGVPGVVWVGIAVLAAAVAVAVIVMARRRAGAAAQGRVED
jgi:uncharacterized protein YcnI